MPTAVGKTARSSRAVPAVAAAGLLLAHACGLAGCAVIDRQFGTPVPLHLAETIDDGTHYLVVLERFGPPATIAPAADGLAMKYESSRIRERQVGLVLPGKIGKWIKAVHGSAEARVHTSVLTFDGDGRLVARSTGVRRVDAGSGFAFSLVFSVGSLTDTALFEEEDAATQWGAAFTEPPLEVLNATHNLDNGQNGVVLIGTPDDVGQESLELPR